MSQEAKIDIGKIIKLGVDKKRITQKDFAKYMDKADSTISEWIKNKSHPSSEDLLKLANFLDIVQDLFPDYKIDKEAMRKEDKRINQEEAEKIWEEIDRIKEKVGIDISLNGNHLSHVKNNKIVIGKR